MTRNGKLWSRSVIGIVTALIGVALAQTQIAGAAANVSAPYQSSNAKTSEFEDPAGPGLATATATANAGDGRLYTYAAASGGGLVGTYIPPYNPLTYIKPVAGVGAAQASARSSITHDIPVLSAGTYTVTAQLDQVVTNSVIGVKPLCYRLPYTQCYYPTDIYLSQAYYYYQASLYLTCYWNYTGASYKTYLGNPYNATGGSMSITGSIYCGAPTDVEVLVVIESFSEAQGDSRTSAEFSARLAGLSLTP